MQKWEGRETLPSPSTEKTRPETLRLEIPPEQRQPEEPGTKEQHRSRFGNDRAKGPKKMIGNTGYRRYVRIEKDAVQIDEEKIANETKFDGIYVLRTNTEFSAKEAALAYKGPWQVERAFFNNISSTRVNRIPSL